MPKPSSVFPSTKSPALLMRRSSLGSVFRKVSAKERTDCRLARSSCMYTTSAFPLSLLMSRTAASALS
uniref:Uncharacterized protein n=1 Tax=Anguilla anguilla TaxID=7936 RepID=A0A0E9WLD3_ANGAN